MKGRHGTPNSAKSLIKLLTPTLHLSNALPDRIASFSKKTEQILSEEQERIIEETIEDKRKLFIGAAGTGKTFIAIEKARRAAKEGKNVLLTCYNKHLVDLLRKQAGSLDIAIRNFHNYLEELLQEKQVWQEPHKDQINEYYQTELAEMGFNYYAYAEETEKFDCILVDEGQDFREEWIICLESMLRKDGEMYIFADPNQNIFGTSESWEHLKKYIVSTQRLTRNFRNTEKINKWILPFVQGRPMNSLIKGGTPIVTHKWKEASEQKRSIESEIGRLISQGVAAKDIMILSPYKREKGSLQGLTHIGSWPLVDFNSREAGINYATIRSFKGLEADILFLIDIKNGSQACTDADVYVGASRARYLLYVFHHEEWSMTERSG